ncbi:MAG: acyl-CoA dehydrogenase family protein [Bacteriovoracaceae bacterium]
MNSYSNSSEWKFLFKHGIDWDNIVSLYHKQFPTADGQQNVQDLVNSYEELLTAIAAWSSNEIKDRARHLDLEGAGTLLDGKTILGKNLAQTYKEANELGLFSLFLDHKYGGQGIPSIMASMMFSHLFKSCLATGTQLGFFISIADMIERFCTDEDKVRLLPQFAAGELSGAMCLTEPGAGSDVGSLRTSAIKQEDGTYLINGSKIFITNGGGGVSFVLARIKGAPKGLEGISLFLVEQKNNNYKVVKIEEKLGFHGSFTCELLFENSVGKLVGLENEGFKYMLHLMNESRLAVGLQCIGGMEACLEYAKNYAATRIQFGKPIAELPLMKRNLNDWQIELDAYRALMIDSMSHYEIYQKLDLKKRHTNDLNSKEEKLFKTSMKWVRRRTPIVKYYGSEAFTALSQKTIQVLGGYGYMKEYDAERLHRDSFAPLLYEGTSQIQALMSFKDVLKKMMKNPTKIIKTLAFNHPLTSLFKQDELGSLFKTTNYRYQKELLKLFIKTLRPLIDLKDTEQVSQFFKTKSWSDEKNVESLMAHAETMIQALSYLETLRVLTLHATKDASRVRLLNEYHDLVKPRLEGIYMDWDVRTKKQN